MDGQQQNADASKQVVMQTVRESGVPPEIYVQMGQMAEEVLRNRSLYPQFADEMIKLGIADREDFSNQVDYQILISIIAMGQVCKEMVQPRGMSA